MFYWIFLIILILGYTLICLRSEWTDIGAKLVIIGFISSFLISPLAIRANTRGEEKWLELEARYERLVDRYENCCDTTPVTLQKEIDEWNEMITQKRKAQKNFFTGPYIPNIYDRLELIELN